jgi:hypothetical protein
MQESGSRCDLFSYEGQGHGFFNFQKEINAENKYFLETVYQTDLFLESLGYLSGKPTVREFFHHKNNSQP